MSDDLPIPHNNELAFAVCRDAMAKLYEAGAEDAAKRELWDMCVIAEGGTPTRKWGGAKMETDGVEDGTLKLKGTRELDAEILKSVDTKVTIGNTTK